MLYCFVLKVTAAVSTPTKTLKKCLRPQHALELGVRKKKNRIIEELSQTFYLSIYVWLLYFIVCLNGYANGNCCFSVIGNSPYFERFVIIFLLGLRSKIQ